MKEEEILTPAIDDQCVVQRKPTLHGTVDL